MLDVRWARENPGALDAALARRGAAPVSADVIALDAARRKAQTRFQDAQSQRRDASKAIGQAKARGEDAAAAIAAVAELKSTAEAAEQAERAAAAELDALLATLPNIPHDDVPDGADETGNVLARTVGQPREFDFEIKDHVALGEPLGMDFAAGVKLAGARFVVMRGQMARLERALAHFMLDLHVAEHGYTEVRPPLLVRDEAMYGTGQLPKFAEDLFQTTEGRWLIPTAEVPLTNLVAGEVLEPDALPMRVTAHTPCFRSEAGAAGRDTRGLIRMHQFDKVEMVSIVADGNGAAELERMTAAAETVLQRLDLPYRVVTLCTGDMGFGARKTYDLEVWLPSQNAYREISSCSECGDFQARRMNARVRRREGKGTDFVHTLNGSGVAVGRALLAVLENHQQADGSIAMPAALQPYLGGMDAIRPETGLKMADPTAWRIDDLSRARTLIVNDDGIEAPGLLLLEQLLRPLVWELWSVAPEKEESGTGHAFSLHNPVRLRSAGERRFAVDGTPTDATIVALGVAMRDTPPDLVVTGVNRGANLGDDVTYSGTVGAAMEAALSGFPAIAFSQNRTPPHDAKWETTAAHLVPTLQRLLSTAWPRHAVLNVNFPDVPPDDVQGVRATRLGRRKPGGEILAGMDPAGKPFHWIGSKRILGEIAPDSDVAADREGYISMTPLTYDLTDEALLASARERLGP